MQTIRRAQPSDWLGRALGRTALLVVVALSAAYCANEQACAGERLDVLFIRREPMYPCYRVNYWLPGHDDEPRLAGQGGQLLTQDTTKRWPAEGEIVTYTAEVANSSADTVQPFPYVWTVDGATVKSGTSDRPLPPGGRIAVSFSMPWRFARQEVAVEVGTEAEAPRISRYRSVWTHAKWFRVRVLRSTFESMDKVLNRFGSHSCADWVQAHADRMNALFAASRYPTAPAGILERVAIGELVVADRPGFDQGDANGVFDGNWGIDFGDHAESRAAVWDWGLIHEWGHQLGLADLYQLDVPAEKNDAPGEDGLPERLGHDSVFRGTMMHRHADTPFSEVCAIALNHQLWRRRGYFGDYYYAMPSRCLVRLLDADDKPVEGGELRFYQRRPEGGVIAGPPVFTGQTGQDGRFELPNRPAPDVATFGDRDGGYQLSPNPYGKINLWGDNGVLFVEVAARGQRDAAFLEVPQWVVARARAGDAATEVTLDLSCRVPSAAAPARPARPEVQLVGDQVVVSAPGLAEFAVVRRGFDTMDRQRWEEVGRGRDGHFSEPRAGVPTRRVVQYAVCAAAGGVNSARSAARRLVNLGNPWGVAVAPDGSLLVRDRGGLWMTHFTELGEPIDNVGSQHWHFDGTPDLAVDTGGIVWAAEWPQWYDPDTSGLRRFALAGPFGGDDAPFVVRGPWNDTAPGRFRAPMGISVAVDGTLVVADTGNDRVQLLTPQGKVKAVIDGLHHPDKAILQEGRLYVADTGARRVLAYRQEGAVWRPAGECAGFAEPVYLCVGPRGVIWVSDRSAGRVVTLDPETLVRTGWEWDRVPQPRGIAYLPRRNAIACVSGGERLLVIEQLPKTSSRPATGVAATTGHRNTTGPKTVPIAREPLRLDRAEGLSSLSPARSSQGWGELHRDASVQGSPLTIGGRRYVTGLGTHANAEQVLELAGRYTRLTCEVGVDDEINGNPASSVIFRVIADGKTLFDSGIMRAEQPAQPVDVSLEGVNELRLIVTDAGDGISSDHADWANALLAPK